MSRLPVPVREILRSTTTFTFTCYGRYRHAYVLCQNQKKVGERCAQALQVAAPRFPRLDTRTRYIVVRNKTGHRSAHQLRP